MKQLTKNHQRRATSILVRAIALISALVAVTAPADAEEAAPSTRHTYEVVSVPGGLSWSDANAAANAMTAPGGGCGGHLATINSAAEQAEIVALFGSSVLFEKWVGGYQAPGAADATEGWAWVTGEPWDYTNWNPFEPNDFGGTEEDALVLYFSDASWNDAPANFHYGNGGFVVEFECQQISIDIKPDSSENTINNDGNGVIPVAILTTDSFDASTIDAATASLDGAGARVKGKSGKAGVLTDVDGDGDVDLLLHIQDGDGIYEPGDVLARLTALTHSGDAVYGSDLIRIVPKN